MIYLCIVHWSLSRSWCVLHSYLYSLFYAHPPSSKFPSPSYWLSLLVVHPDDWPSIVVPITFQFELPQWLLDSHPTVLKWQLGYVSTSLDSTLGWHPNICALLWVVFLASLLPALNHLIFSSLLVSLVKTFPSWRCPNGHMPRLLHGDAKWWFPMLTIYPLATIWPMKTQVLQYQLLLSDRVPYAISLEQR